MKAIVQDTYGSAEVLQLRDIDEPAVGEDEVRIRVAAASVFIGDWHIMAGMPYVFRLAAGTRAPKVRVRGQDVAGLVDAVGERVTQFRIGDEVFGTCAGAFAEFAVAKADKIAAKPQNLSFEQAAAVPITGTTALQAVRHCGVGSGRIVLVVGAAGGVGSFAVQIAKAFGAHVAGVCSTNQVELVRSIGADDVIDYTREDVSAAGRRFDVILDTAGGRSVSDLRRVLVPRGSLVIVGGEGGGRWFGGIQRQLGAHLLSIFVGQKLGTFVARQNAGDLLILKELIEAGKVKPVIGSTYPLTDVPTAMRSVTGPHPPGKIVITV
jgi:NADPH:quinone reductase-like Zn-dependent oxidoreductase